MISQCSKYGVVIILPEVVCSVGSPHEANKKKMEKIIIERINLIKDLKIDMFIYGFTKLNEGIYAWFVKVQKAFFFVK